MAIKVIAPTQPTLKVAQAPAKQVDVFVQRGVPGPVGPQGIQGMQGVQGPVGPIGPAGADGTAAVIEHIADVTPHPAYDDLPSLTLQFENGLV